MSLRIQGPCGAVAIAVAVFALSLDHAVVRADFVAQDPGVRSGAPSAGGPLPGLTSAQLAFFENGKEDFAEAEGVGDGIGPSFNLDSCVGCHSQPAVGGTSPAINPQIAVATAFGARNVVPSFIKLDGPVREARFVAKADGSPDGGVHSLFVISGRIDGTGDASGCALAQEDFATQVAKNNVVFRIPTPLFGSGLIEAIRDSDLIANLSANTSAKAAAGVVGKLNRTPSGNPNNNGNDGTVARFGWKAQNKSLMLFSGEAYNVEMGITNELFGTERAEKPGCQFASVPNDIQDLDSQTALDATMAIQKFAHFMRFLAPPQPSLDTPGGAASIARGKQRFLDVGCHLCHTPAFTTDPQAAIAAMRSKPVPLYSDLALHSMGPGLADGVSQGEANGSEFRTAPLWGLGQRIFLMHDGRTRDLRQAIVAHRGKNNGGKASEANKIVDQFDALSETNKQDLLNFLRSL